MCPDEPTQEQIQAFLEDYREVCRKHGLMVISEGEQVEVYWAAPTLWGLVIPDGLPMGKHAY